MPAVAAGGRQQERLRWQELSGCGSAPSRRRQRRGCSNRPQRMILRHPLLRRNITEHRRLLAIRPAHPSSSPNRDHRLLYLIIE